MPAISVPVGHLMVRLVLADGRELLASPGHRAADGRQLGSLASGDALDGSTVTRWELVPYSGDRTYDLLPAGGTGRYAKLRIGVLYDYWWNEDEDRNGEKPRPKRQSPDEDVQEVVDAAIYWWRDGDGDLVDSLVDALTNLADGGMIWLLTPKSGRDGHVEPSDIDEAAPTAGLSSTRSTSAAPEWSGTRLVAPKAARAKQQRR